MRLLWAKFEFGWKSDNQAREIGRRVTLLSLCKVEWIYRFCCSVSDPLIILLQYYNFVIFSMTTSTLQDVLVARTPYASMVCKTIHFGKVGIELEVGHLVEVVHTMASRSGVYYLFR